MSLLKPPRPYLKQASVARWMVEGENIEAVAIPNGELPQGRGS